MITLPGPLAAGQKIPATWLNAVDLAAQEIQRATVAQPWVELARLTTEGPFSAGGWWLIGFDASPTGSAGVGLVGTVDGVLVAAAGRFQCYAAINWSVGGAAGEMRTLAIDTVTAGWRNTRRTQQASPVTAQMMTCEVTAAVGDLIGVYIYTTDTTAANNALSSMRLCVRKVG